MPSLAPSLRGTKQSMDCIKRFDCNARAYPLVNRILGIAPLRLIAELKPCTELLPAIVTSLPFVIPAQEGSHHALP
jgi:hypothetical protein